VETPKTQPVLVEEVELDDQPPAFLVRPADAGSSHPAVLWLHWLGHNRSNRTQFLAEAVRLAQQGVVSLLPQGVFPWLERWCGSCTPPRHRAPP
jgi:dienelactone hydrolase